MPSENAPGTSHPEALGRLGRFQLVRHIATGGMAEIYLASASGVAGFKTTVVLKRILPIYANNRQFIRMFLDEARIAATLQHPNIAQVYEVSEEEGSYYFAMEFVPGTDMRQVLRAGHRAHRPLPLAYALAVCIDVTCALHYAHEKVGYDGRPLGIVHRDVSPANVLVSFEGVVKLVDFGIAKAAWRTSETRAGQLKGKFAYMSPEQARGEEIDRRSDVFSAGILLHELTTRRKLFVGNNELAVLNQVQRCEPIPPSAKVADYPKDLERIVMKALQPRAAERYQTAQDLQLELEEFAARNSLVVSQGEMGQYLREVFGLTDPGWRERLEAGVALADLLPAGLVDPRGPGSGSGSGSGSGAHDAAADALAPTGLADEEPVLDTDVEVVEEEPDATTVARAAPAAAAAAEPLAVTRAGHAVAGPVGPPAAPPAPAASEEPELTTMDVRPAFLDATPDEPEATVQASPLFDSDRTVQAAPGLAWPHPAGRPVAGELVGAARAAPAQGDGPTSVEVHLDAGLASAPVPWDPAPLRPPPRAPAPTARVPALAPAYAPRPAAPAPGGLRSWRPLLVGLLVGLVLAVALVAILTRVLGRPAPVPAPAPATQPLQPAPPR
jgi:tRNA A-37 threonylcarbamoyl transferase component Bud32